jgi:hypothetical protein
MNVNMVNNRSVAFLDVLGFKKLISSMPLAELVEKYESMVKSTEAMNRPFQYNGTILSLFPDHPNNHPWCKRYIFSDSIILISLGDDAVSFLKLIVYARKLFQALLAMRLPARGAIAFGELYENPELNIVLGRALTDAYTLEQKQQWIGVAVDEALEEKYPEIFSLMKPDTGVLRDVFLKYPVPFKDGATKMMHTLNWRFNFIVENGTKSLFSETSDESARKKIENTLEYARTVVESGRIYVKEQDKLPVELRSFYVGSKKPPFSHGDEL